MNLKAHYPGFKVWAGAQADIERVVTIWRECFAASKGPYLFGKEPCMADAMYAPVVTRFLTYDVKLDPQCAAYCKTIMAMPLMEEWNGDAPPGFSKRGSHAPTRSVRRVWRLRPRAAGRPSDL